jgi:hypothetical protein
VKRMGRTEEREVHTMATAVKSTAKLRVAVIVLLALLTASIAGPIGAAHANCGSGKQFCGLSYAPAGGPSGRKVG